ncbi:hypothetical protein RchiOBHm_Chr7g0210931 [Rosa chinensis]|uniref:Uncharacterized protein n=1 Tax=Rosa chinensis TaxID=74649 RepID=A0A2P6PAC6_ROSCH|nr:hypothetical protein RchiOBHm_Chr7g0210931 [Rosa chinensis]
MPKLLKSHSCYRHVLKLLSFLLELKGATMVDKIVTISPVENYVLNNEMPEVRMVESAVCAASAENVSPNAERTYDDIPGSLSMIKMDLLTMEGCIYVNRAQDVVSSMFAKDSAIGQDAVNKAKAFDGKHQLIASDLRK